MTEAEWLTTKLPLYMLCEYPGAWDKRKVRLFWCACMRHTWHLVSDEPSRRLVELAENVPDGDAVVPPAEVDAVRRRLDAGLPEYPYLTGRYHPDYWALGVILDRAPSPLIALVDTIANRAAEDAGRASGLQPGSSAWRRVRDDAEAAEKARQCELIREVFGNPFRRVHVSPWLTSDVVALARGIYEEKAFDRMPILADALQDAGCDNVNVLDHCREAREHVRGCWVVDLLLGK